MSPPTTVAAAISYRPVPLGDAVDYGDVAGASVEAYELTSLDARSGLAVHLQPDAGPRDAPVIISIHGSGGSVTSEPVHKLCLGMVAAGFPVLAVNTRQSGDAVNTDNFWATVRDIEAAHWMAGSLGHDRVVLHGHSLGTSQVSAYAATHWRPGVLGVVLTGMFADLAWKSRHLLIRDEAVYGALTGEAIAAVQEGDFARLLSIAMPWLGGRTTPVSAEHFLTYRREGLAGAISTTWVARIPYPLLMIRDVHDSVIHDFEPGWLQAAAEAGLSPSVSVVSLESEAGSEGHRFDTSGPALVDTVAKWVGALPARLA
ncbi:MAG: alpha/beta hydrolase [Acidimicrobiales bacterium]